MISAAIWILMITLPTGIAFPHTKYYTTQEKCYAALYRMTKEDMKLRERGSHTNQTGYRCIPVEKDDE